MEKNKFTRTGFRKVRVGPRGRARVAPCVVRFTVSRSIMESVCVHVCVCIYRYLSI